MSTSNQRNIYILAFTLIVMMLGLGVVIPIMPFYVENLGAGGIELGLLAASYAAMRLIFGPIWGGLSDRYGRKPILMIGVLGYGIAMVLFGMSTRLWMLFVSRILSGILSSATSPTTMAYIGDSTTKDERGRGMGILMFIAFFTLTTALLSPAVSALISKWSNMEQGITMGWSNAFMSLGRIIGPLWAGFVFDVNIEYPYISGAVIMFVGFLIVWAGFKRVRRPSGFGVQP
ncbi:MAG: MFS transporter [Anaerolineales bacterium]|nr:MFS transporter [Anaerolineales bacterium]